MMFLGFVLLSLGLVHAAPTRSKVETFLATYESGNLCVDAIFNGTWGFTLIQKDLIIDGSDLTVTLKGGKTSANFDSRHCYQQVNQPFFRVYSSRICAFLPGVEDFTGATISGTVVLYWRVRKDDIAEVKEINHHGRIRDVKMSHEHYDYCESLYEACEGNCLQLCSDFGQRASEPYVFCNGTLSAVTSLQRSPITEQRASTNPTSTMTTENAFETTANATAFTSTDPVTAFSSTNEQKTTMSSTSQRIQTNVNIPIGHWQVVLECAAMLMILLPIVVLVITNKKKKK